MGLDMDTKAALVIAPICGGIGGGLERFVLYAAQIRDKSLSPMDQIGYLKEQSLHFVLYVVAAAVVTTIFVTAGPINLQNRRLLIGTCLMLGLMWPSVLDHLAKVLGPATVGLWQAR